MPKRSRPTNARCSSTATTRARKAISAPPISPTTGPDKALPHLKRAVQLAPDRATFLSNLGYAYQLAGKLELAIETYRKALAKDEKLGSAWINLGTALARKKEYDEAEKAFNSALALDPQDPRAKANLSELAELRKATGKGPAKR